MPAPTLGLTLAAGVECVGFAFELLMLRETACWLS